MHLTREMRFWCTWVSAPSKSSETAFCAETRHIAIPLEAVTECLQYSMIISKGNKQLLLSELLSKVTVCNSIVLFYN